MEEGWKYITGATKEQGSIFICQKRQDKKDEKFTATKFLNIGKPYNYVEGNKGSIQK